MNASRQLERLRPDLQILRTGPDHFRLLDPHTGAHFELGGKERYLLSLIDRCDSVAEVSAEYEQKFRQPLAEREILEFLEQLRCERLLVGDKVAPPPAAGEIPHHSALFFDLRGTSANVFFDVLTLFFGWLIHPIWLVVIIPACVLEVALIAHRWPELLFDLRRTLYDVPLVLLFLATYTQAILLLNLPMALSTGMCCRKFEGRVRSFGLAWGNWVLPTVSFFTDVGDSLLGMSERGRRAMVSIGIVVPLALGAFYALCWGVGSRAHEGHKFWAFILVPTTIVALCQCNPFSIQSSAHWALALAVDDWKLHSRAIAETKAWFWGWTSPEPLSRRERWRLRAYGTAHYILRFAADLALLFGGGYLLVRAWGTAGAALMLLLVLFWNRRYLSTLWRWSGNILIDLWEFLTPARSR